MRVDQGYVRGEKVARNLSINPLNMLMGAWTCLCIMLPCSLPPSLFLSSFSLFLRLSLSLSLSLSFSLSLRLSLSLSLSLLLSFISPPPFRSPLPPLSLPPSLSLSLSFYLFFARCVCVCLSLSPSRYIHVHVYKLVYNMIYSKTITSGNCNALVHHLLKRANIINYVIHLIAKNNFFFQNEMTHVR